MRTAGLIVMTAFLIGSAALGLEPHTLKCEYKNDPLGVDVLQPRLSWQLRAKDVSDERQTAYQILVSASPEGLKRDEGSLWDSGKVDSSAAFQVVYAGQPLSSRMQCWWKVRVWNKDGEPSEWSEPARWTMGLLQPEDWSARWIGYDAPAPADAHAGELQLPPPPFLRKDFEAKGKLRRATLYATALGLYEMTFNGKRVGEYHLTPGWTDYHKRVYYVTHDVTDLVRRGENAWGAVLADGWYAGYLGFRLLQNTERPRNFYKGEPRLLAQLELEYEDGSTERIVTDESWRAKYGPIQEADLLMGETRDLRVDLGKWNERAYDASGWEPVTVSPAIEPAPKVEAHPGNPVRKYDELPAKSVQEISPGVWVYDLGQNIVGWARIQASGKAGQRVQVRHAEMLQPDGTLYTVALRKARAIDSYYLRGGELETLEPEFTFHGFRYVEISGLEKPPAIEDVVGVVIATPLEQTGHFECSEPLLNQLYHNIVWGQRGNYLEIPTDCPQRDERLGWTGDAQFFMPTSAYISDVSAFFTKWLVDLVQDSQLPDGSWADVAPNVELGGGAVAWGDAAIICTYQMYQYYADEQVIEQHFDQLVKGIDFLEGTSENFIRKKMGYGDWLNLGGGAKDEVICTAYFAYLTGLMREMAQVIGRTQEAQRFAALEQNIRAAFAREFIKEDGSILDSSQTGYALAFTMNLIPEALREKAAQQFVKEIERFDNHLATGFIGTPRLLPALDLAGQHDTAYRLLLTKTFPSWLYQVTLGATTMWERWDGWTPEKGFQDPGMNSFNHYAFGAVGEYLFSTVGGIRSAAPGFTKVIIAPKPGGGLGWAKTRYDSISGTYASEWRLLEDKFFLSVEVPPNTTVEVVLPVPSPEAIELAEDARDGRKLEASEGVRYTVGSGQYAFHARLKQ